MADAYPSFDEFGPGSCTCRGTMTGCAVCAAANLLVRYGKPIPRLPGGTPDMRALGRRMGARHRAAAAPGTPGDRHGTSLDGHCTGGTNWCSYCIFLELKANGLPVAYGRRTGDQIIALIQARKPVAIPGQYGKVPYVFPKSYDETRPARGRSDAGFGGPHMVVGWAASTSSTSIVSDSDFGSPSRPVVPPHSVWTNAVIKGYWAALGWSVCWVTVPPPSLAVAVKWGSDVPKVLRDTDPTSARTVRAFVKAGRGFESTINMVDLRRICEHYHVRFKTAINPIDMQALFRAARV